MDENIAVFAVQSPVQEVHTTELYKAMSTSGLLIKHRVEIGLSALPTHMCVILLLLQLYL